MSAKPPGEIRSWNRRWWRWVKRAALALVLILLVAVVFHRTWLRWAVGTAVPYLAERAGYKVEWLAGGSVTSDLTLERVKISGPEGGLVKSVTLERAAFFYKMAEWWSLGPGRVLKTLHLEGVDVDLDLRAGGKPKGERPAQDENKEGGGGLQVWVDKVDLREVSLRLRTGDGDVLVRGLTLQLEEGTEGVLRIRELVVPSANLHLTDVEGRTAVAGRTVMLRGWRLRPGVVVDMLAVNLMELGKSKLPLVLDVRSGEGRIAASGTMDWAEGLVVDLGLALEKFGLEEVARWVKMPEGLDWRVEHGLLNVKGNPAMPGSIQLEVGLLVSGVKAAGYEADQVLLKAGAENGKLRVGHLSVFSGQNLAAADGGAVLPGTWGEMKGLEAAVNWWVQAPEIATLAKDAGWSGMAWGRGSVALANGGLSGADGVLEGVGLRLPGVALPASLKAEVRTEGRTLTVKALRLWWDEAHEVGLNGRLALEGQQEGDFSWSASLDEVGRLLPAAVKDKMGGEPPRGKVEAQGRARFAVKALQAGDRSGVMADATLAVRDVRWKSGMLPELTASMQCERGMLRLPSLALDFGGENTLEAAGSAALDGKGPFEVSVKGRFDDLAGVGGWLALAKTPKMLAGRLALDWKVGGTLDRQQLAGGGTLEMDAVRLEGRPETLALSLAAGHDGMHAEVSRLLATAGAWRAEGTASLSPEWLSVPGLALSSGRLKLLNVRAKVPLALDQKPRSKVPLDWEREVEVEVKLEALDVAQVCGLVGVKPPLEGVVDGALRLSGMAKDPVGELAVAITKAQVEAVKGKLGAGELKLGAVLAKGAVKVEGQVRQPPLEPLRITAETALKLEDILEKPQAWKDAAFSGRVNLAKSDLGVVKRFVPALAVFNGDVMLNVALDGTMGEPRWKGLLKADVSAAEMEDVPMGLRDAKVHLMFDEHAVKLAEVSAQVAGGEMRLGGEVGLQDLKNPTLDLKFSAKEALLVRDEAMSLRTDGEVTVRGALAKAELAGRLHLVRGRVFKEVEFLPLSLPNQLPPPPAPVKAVPAELKLPPLLKDWTFKLDVATRDPIRLLGNVLHGGVLVDLKARGTGAAPQVQGKVWLDGARLQLPFSRMNIVKGEVVFDQANPLDPRLDLQGDAFVSGYQVSLFGYGRALDPKLRFTSSPPLSEGEIATLLATGSTGGDLRSSEGVAANRAAFLLISQTYRKVFNKAAPRRYEEEPPKLSFNFSPLSTGGAQRSVSATYELSPKLQATGTISESGSFRGLLHYLVRFR